MLRFGTDGVRGDAERDLTSRLVVGLGRAVARVLHPPRVVIGRDTRASGPRIEADLAAGLQGDGVETVSLGVLPTPAIAFIAATEGVPAAIVSASHNRWSDNGVKVIGADGRKLPDGVEAAIEAELERSSFVAFGARRDTRLAAAQDSGELAALAAIGIPSFGADGASADAYVAHLLSTLDGRGLDGLEVVLDCANGAGFDIGPRVLRAAGARVHVLHAAPDGRNINDGCGSTHPELLRRTVAEHGAALGLALDGDGDRVIAVDERGELVDGDQLMTMTAIDMHARGTLRHSAIAVTVMSNLGLRRAMRADGIRVIETPVGDRYVVAAMQTNDLVLGGEQSGHIVYSEYATTGDGLLTGLLVADLLRRANRPLSALAGQMTRVPQVLVNVRVARRVDVGASVVLDEAVRSIERELGETGRVLVRASGTEPLVRVMIEADAQAMADAAAERLRRVVTREFGRGEET
ncbi:MAG: phosphoglucosamine mutase [Actinomycetota bacterium]|nr:phosphoglucosamine mutase [Actinomycetota bacterium]